MHSPLAAAGWHCRKQVLLRGLPKPVALLLTLRETGNITQKDIDGAVVVIKKVKAK